MSMKATELTLLQYSEYPELRTLSENPTPTVLTVRPPSEFTIKKMVYVIYLYREMLYLSDFKKGLVSQFDCVLVCTLRDHCDTLYGGTLSSGPI